MREYLPLILHFLLNKNYIFVCVCVCVKSSYDKIFTVVESGWLL